MTELVHAFFERALEEQILVGVLPVKFRAQAMQRHDGGALLFVGIAEKKAVTRFIQIEFGNRKQQSVFGWMRPHDLGGERTQKHLAALAVDRGPRHRERAFDVDRIQKPFFQAAGQAIQKRRIDCVNRNYSDAAHAVCTISERSLRRVPRGYPRSATRIFFRMIIGLGLDLAEVARYEFDEEKFAWFARKIYTEEEVAYALRKRNRAERFAGFYAAKEATRKAFGHAIRGDSWACRTREAESPSSNSSVTRPNCRRTGAW